MRFDPKTIMLALGALALMGSSKKSSASGSHVVIPKAGAQMNLDQLRALARSAGFPEESVDVAAAVAMAESGGYEAAVGDQGKSFGLWQIHHPSHPTFEPSLLLTASYNAAAALSISQHGTNWQPWTTFRNGDYHKYMPVPLAPASPIAGELAPEAIVASELDEPPEETTEVSAATVEEVKPPEAGEPS